MADDAEPGLNAKAVAQRLAFLCPHLNDGVPLVDVAADAGIPIRTARRWLARYRKGGPAALERPKRPEAGTCTFPIDLIELIEGMTLQKPPSSVARIKRRIDEIAGGQGWPIPCYGSVRGIVRRISPAMLTLAHEGGSAFRDKYELVHRHRAARPNATWQADHTMLDVMILDADGKEARPWLSTVLDDHSRVLAGYMVFLGAPSALNTSLALRQAIWRKADPAWQVCGIPDMLYIDHGTDFISQHLEQAAADLRITLTYSAIARPQGRGKIERFFGTINTELLPGLPGHVYKGKPVSPPRLSLSELDALIGAFIVTNYNVRPHSSIGSSPLDAWRGDGWLPRMPETLSELDALLVMVAKPRTVQRDGIRFQGLRYFDTTLAAYVGEPVTIRYDPRDITEIRVFHRNKFLCRAVDPDHSDQNIALKDIQAARVAYRRQLRNDIKQKTGRVADFLPATAPRGPTVVTSSTRPAEDSASPNISKRRRLRIYVEGE